MDLIPQKQVGVIQSRQVLLGPQVVVAAFSGLWPSIANDKQTPEWYASYKDQLTEWVKRATVGNRDCYQTVADVILRSLIEGQWHKVQINCLFLDTLPPLPPCEGISLVLRGEPDVAVEMFLAHLPGNVVSLTFCENDAIHVFSSEMVPASVKELHIENCPNFTHFSGKFDIQALKLSQLTGKTLALLTDQFPTLQELELEGNSNLESIEVSEGFTLQWLRIEGDHNKLTAMPLFSEHLRIGMWTGLASVSDYSWFYGTKDFIFPVFDAIKLAKKHHEQGEPAAARKLIEMSNSLLYGLNRNYYYATCCLKALIGNSTASSMLAKLFLEGKLTSNEYLKVQNFFQEIVSLEENLKEKEVLNKFIELFVAQCPYQVKHPTFEITHAADKQQSIPTIPETIKQETHKIAGSQGISVGEYNGDISYVNKLSLPKHLEAVMFASLKKTKAKLNEHIKENLDILQSNDGMKCGTAKVFFEPLLMECNKEDIHDLDWCAVKEEEDVYKLTLEELLSTEIKDRLNEYELEGKVLAREKLLALFARDK